LHGFGAALIVQAKLQDDEPEPEPHCEQLLQDAEKVLGWEGKARAGDGGEHEHGAWEDHIEELVAREEVERVKVVE
jgi:hypothetical protein